MSPSAGPNTIGSPARVEVVAEGDDEVVATGAVVVVAPLVLVDGSIDVVVDEGATVVLVAPVSTPPPQAATRRPMVTRPNAVRLM
jgi:hypothetical protein